MSYIVVLVMVCYFEANWGKVIGIIILGYFIGEVILFLLVILFIGGFGWCLIF